MLYDIAPFLTYIRFEQLYALRVLPATVFAISICKGETLKFQAIVDDKTLFSNVQLSSLVNDKMSQILKEEDSIYFPCPEDNANILQHEYLSVIEHCGVWKKDNTFWSKGIYVFTIEWQISKQQLHLLELEDGNYVFWPDEKITWGEDIPDELPQFE